MLILRKGKLITATVEHVRRRTPDWVDPENVNGATPRTPRRQRLTRPPGATFGPKVGAVVHWHHEPGAVTHGKVCAWGRRGCTVITKDGTEWRLPWSALRLGIATRQNEP